MMNNTTINTLNKAISFRLISWKEVIERERTFPKKIRLKAHNVYTAPKTILVAAKNVPQKLC